jgi:hypothetical protein
MLEGGENATECRVTGFRAAIERSGHARDAEQHPAPPEL